MRTIRLSQGFETMVDDEDYEELINYNWTVSKSPNTNYALRRIRIGKGKRFTQSMHALIAKTPKGMVTDHIDGNGLNNCKQNLRVVTYRQNTQNKHTTKSSIYPGVYWFKLSESWNSRIQINHKIKSLGYFNNEIDAYNAYLKALKSIGEVCIKGIVQA